MDLTQAIVWWGLIALACSAAAGILAFRKNRDVSFWMSWCFVLPPLVLMLLPMTRLSVPRPRPTQREYD